MSTVEERLQRLEDRDAIHQLFTDYGRALDLGDWARYAGLFAADGEVKLGGIGKASGREAIQELMESKLSSRVGTYLHVIGSPDVTLDGDSATAVVQWVAIGKGEKGEPVITSMGEHLDELSRVDGHWFIQRRKGKLDMAPGYPPA